ncbi:MAG: dephospho-CoA kinase [Acidobacteriota bacterium]|nr:dephospho-CoA kinase [Acidobacteriota bacterium]
MVRVAITGGIACGKSTVLQMFADLPHVAVLSADAIVHQLYLPGETVHNRVVAEFGRAILDPGGRIDRKKLADEAFRAPERRQKLESIVHPAVSAHEVKWMDHIAASSPETNLAVIEVPLLFEAKSEGNFAKTIAVTSTAEKKLARYKSKHPELSEAEAGAELERRSASQLPDAEKAGRADFVVDNSGTMDATRAQVKKIYQQLTPQLT